MLAGSPQSLGLALLPIHDHRVKPGPHLHGQRPHVIREKFVAIHQFHLNDVNAATQEAGAGAFQVESHRRSAACGHGIDHPRFHGNEIVRTGGRRAAEEQFHPHESAFGPPVVLNRRSHDGRGIDQRQRIAECQVGDGEVVHVRLGDIHDHDFSRAFAVLPLENLRPHFRRRRIRVRQRTRPRGTLQVREERDLPARVRSRRTSQGIRHDGQCRCRVRGRMRRLELAQFLEHFVVGVRGSGHDRLRGAAEVDHRVPVARVPVLDEFLGL